MQIKNPDQRYKICREEVLADFKGKVSAKLVNAVWLAPMEMKTCLVKHGTAKGEDLLKGRYKDNVQPYTLQHLEDMTDDFLL